MTFSVKNVRIMDSGAFSRVAAKKEGQHYCNFIHCIFHPKHFRLLCAICTEYLKDSMPGHQNISLRIEPCSPMPQKARRQNKKELKITYAISLYIVRIYPNGNCICPYFPCLCQ